jgi:hypothetical protein
MLAQVRKLLEFEEQKVDMQTRAKAPQVKVGKEYGKKTDPSKCLVVTIPPSLSFPDRIPLIPAFYAGIAVNVPSDEVAKRVAGKRPRGQRECVPQDDETSQSQRVVVGERHVKVVVEERQEDNTCVEEIPVQIFEQKDEIFLAGIFSGCLVQSFGVVAGERVMENMAVVVFSVSIAGEPEDAGDRYDQHCRAVKRIDVAFDLRDRIGGKHVNCNREENYETPEPPVRFNELVWKERLRLLFLQRLPEFLACKKFAHSIIIICPPHQMKDLTLLK